MKLIWPGRALGVVLLVPALTSLLLFVTESILPILLAVDAAVGLVALFDLLSLAGVTRIVFERHMSQVCSLDEPQEVELVIDNPGRTARHAAAP